MPVYAPHGAEVPVEYVCMYVRMYASPAPPLHFQRSYRKEVLEECCRTLLRAGIRSEVRVQWPVGVLGAQHFALFTVFGRHS